jgi:hypothetical protein
VNVIAITVFLAQIGLFVLRQFADHFQDHAEGIRRMAMLQDGLGIQPSPVTMARLYASVGGVHSGEPSFLGSYYESSLPLGPRRLIEMTAECAFFTGENARWLWRRLAWIAGTGLVVAVAAFLGAVLFTDSPTAPKLVAKIVIPAMAFCAAGDLASMAFLFRSMAESCNQVLLDGEHALQQREDSQAEQNAALVLFTEYNCAVVKSPPIPAAVYRHRQSILNQAWRNRHGEPSSAPTAE